MIVRSIGSCGCEATGHQLDACDVKPGDRAFDGGLEILGQTAVAVKPGQSAFNHPASGQQDKTLGGIGSLDDLDCPVADLGESILQLVAGIGAVGKDVAQPGKALRTLASRGGAPSRSWILAGWTIAPTTRPMVSVRMWRLRPLIIFSAA